MAGFCAKDYNSRLRRTRYIASLQGYGSVSAAKLQEIEESKQCSLVWWVSEKWAQT